jgi:serine/threonine protein kinase
VVITDFSIARVWQPGEGPAQATYDFVGTPEYMSPEQAEGAAIDLRTDIYSLGVFVKLCRLPGFSSRIPDPGNGRNSFPTSLLTVRARGWWTMDWRSDVPKRPL